MADDSQFRERRQLHDMSYYLPFKRTSHDSMQSFNPWQVFLTVLPVLLRVRAAVIIGPIVFFSAGKALSEAIKAVDT